jgi:hypothetical protein
LCLSIILATVSMARSMRSTVTLSPTEHRHKKSAGVPIARCTASARVWNSKSVTELGARRNFAGIGKGSHADARQQGQCRP